MKLQWWLVECKDQIVTIKLNAPPANTLSVAVLEELDRLVRFLETDDSSKAVILTAQGRHFCAGADIRELAQISTIEQGRTFARRGQGLFNRIEALDKPVVAAISGACVGGGLELAMACHIRIAGHDAFFGLPELDLGIIPGFGGTQRLPRLVGSARAMEMILTGSRLSADEAMAAGLVSDVQLRSELLPRAHVLAESIVRKSRSALRGAMQALRIPCSPPAEEDLEQEASLFATLLQTRDAKEGLLAFIEKRPPRFTDR
ncbi:MAG: enoyl-CoA hydratase [Nitrospirae bacterium]|nr:MAG: enoyl-CoA hydratase [Nitrospirota bacterium]